MQSCFHVACHCIEVHQHLSRTLLPCRFSPADADLIFTKALKSVDDCAVTESSCAETRRRGQFLNLVATVAVLEFLTATSVSGFACDVSLTSTPSSRPEKTSLEAIVSVSSESQDLSSSAQICLIEEIPNRLRRNRWPPKQVSGFSCYFGFRSPLMVFSTEVCPRGHRRIGLEQFEEAPALRCATALSRRCASDALNGQARRDIRRRSRAGSHGLDLLSIGTRLFHGVSRCASSRGIQE